MTTVYPTPTQEDDEVFENDDDATLVVVYVLLAGAILALTAFCWWVLR